MCVCVCVCVCVSAKHPLNSYTLCLTSIMVFAESSFSVTATLMVVSGAMLECGKQP